MIIPNIIKSIEKSHQDMKIQGKIEGKREGIQLVKRVLKLSSEGETIENIAKICEISVDDVREILE